MTTLVIDCETLPLAASLNAEYPASERPHPANFKNEEAISNWRVKDEAAWREGRVKECSLSPRLGRIACFGYALDDKEPVTLLAREEGEERALLERVWDLIADSPRLVGFNSSFDLRFIAVRSAIHGVDTFRYSAVRDWFARYRTSPHYDVRAVLCGWDDRVSGRLHEWAASFGIPCNDESIGADVYGFAQADRWDLIAHHCKIDVAVTRDLYRRISIIFT
jgi:hypothetical protein